METTEHQRMIKLLCETKVLHETLNLPNLWIRKLEYVIDEITKEKADLVFQDNYDSFNRISNITCYVLELKSDIADHEVVGQLKKYIAVIDKKGKSTGHWNKTIGIAVAKSFTESGLSLLKQENYQTYIWNEINEKITLTRI